MAGSLGMGWILLAGPRLGPKGGCEEAQVLAELFAALSRGNPAWPPVKLILLAGNLSGDASAQSFRRVTQLVADLRRHLPGAGDATVVAVPGPCDRNQPSKDQRLKLRVLRDWDDPDDEDVAEVKRRLLEDHDPRLIGPLFAGLQRWAREIMPAQLCRSYFPGDSAVVLQHGGRRLGIVALNSAWRWVPAAIEGMHLPLLSAEQLQAAVTALDPQRPGLSNFDLADHWLLLTHHSPAGLDKTSAFDELIGPADRFTAMLHQGPSSRCVSRSVNSGPMRRYLQVGPVCPHEAGDGAFAVIGSVGGGGELRLWPLRRQQHGDGSYFFGWDDSFGEEQAAGIVAGAGAEAAATPVAAEDPARREYLEWARRQCRFVNMVGVTGGDYHFDLEQIHVPLRLSGSLHGRERHGEADAEMPGINSMPEYDDREVSVDQVFASTTQPRPHVLITGNPGSGKTTSLRKLQHLCLSGWVPGLDQEAVPIFLRLRHFTEGDAEGTLAGLVERLLAEQREPVPGLAESLCSGPALLLLDGLDEIADPALRARFCGCLDRWLPVGPGQLRVVLSSRPAGLTSSVDPGRRFLAMEVRPLSDPEVVDLVHRWFAEAARKLPDAGHSVRERDRLLAALRTPAYSTQAWKVLTGNPLLLTLLCLLTLRGHRMPDSRGEFYGRCLEVLLERHGDGGAQSPLTKPQVVSILRKLAFAMHQQRAVDVSTARLVEIISPPLRASGEPCTPLTLLDWLYRHAGVLERFGRHRYGFLHLGLQEYLSAIYLRDDGTRELPEITAGLSGPEDRWWHEPLLLLASLAGRQAASALLAALCRGSAELSGLVEECLSAMSEVDLQPLSDIAADEQAADSRRQQARRLLAVHRPQPAVASRIAEQTLLLCHQPVHTRQADDLARDLRAQGWLEVEQVPAGHGWLDHIEQVMDASAVAVLVGPDAPPPWQDDDTTSSLRTLAGEGKPLVLVQLPGLRGMPEPPAGLQGRWVEAEAPVITASLVVSQPPAPEATPEATAETTQPLLDEVTGIYLLPIPGGTFRMGAADFKHASPVHEVCLSPFRLAETPVTNAQYGRFLAATNHREPRKWRDGRFSDPQQPVVDVSWRDALEFCHWATKASSLVYSLPSEAQWEYAARGEQSRTYPWGEEKPTPEHACYGLDYSSGKPAQVGAHPKGAGPYGTQDQAGLVWEWCLDHWDENAYRRRKNKRATDPVVESDKGDGRVWRGGCWANSAQSLRAASRGRFPAAGRYGLLGFRVAVARASAVTLGSRGEALGRNK